MFPTAHGVVSQIFSGQPSGGGEDNWSLDGATFVQTLDISGVESLPRCLCFSPDGTRMYVGGRGSGYALHQYALSTAWDINTASHVYTMDVSAFAEPKGITIKPDGTRLLVSLSNVHQLDLSTPWDLSTATVIGDANVSFPPRGLAVSEDGLTMLSIDGSRNIRSVTLASPWVVAGAAEKSFVSLSAQDVTPYALAAGDSGARLYIGGQSNDTVFAYDLSSPWDITTLAYANESLDVNDKEGIISGVFVKPTGGSMWITGPGSDAIHEYALTAN